jgi:hypothetical protein
MLRALRSSCHTARALPEADLTHCGASGAVAKDVVAFSSAAIRMEWQLLSKFSTRFSGWRRDSATSKMELFDIIFETLFSIGNLRRFLQKYNDACVSITSCRNKYTL